MTCPTSESRAVMPRIDRPEPGFWRTRLVKGGPYVGARIARECRCTINGGDANSPHDWRESCDRYPRLTAEIDGRPADVPRLWTSRKEPITEAEYRYLVDDRAWCRDHAPETPESRPRDSVRLGDLPPIF